MWRNILDRQSFTKTLIFSALSKSAPDLVRLTDFPLRADSFEALLKKKEGKKKLHLLYAAEYGWVNVELIRYDKI